MKRVTILLATAIFVMVFAVQAQAGWGCAKCAAAPDQVQCEAKVCHPVAHAVKALVHCLVCKHEVCVCPKPTVVVAAPAVVVTAPAVEVAVVKPCVRVRVLRHRCCH